MEHLGPIHAERERNAASDIVYRLLLDLPVYRDSLAMQLAAYHLI